MSGKALTAPFLQDPVTGKYAQIVHYSLMNPALSVVPTEVQNAWGRLPPPQTHLSWALINTQKKPGLIPSV